MLKKEKEKFYIITALSSLIGIVLIWQGIFSARAAIGNKILEILDKKAFIGAYSQREKDLPAALINYSGAKEKIDEMNKLFMDGTNSVEVGKFFGDLEGIAAETSIGLDKVFIENPEAVKKTVKKPSAAKEGETETAPEDKFLRLTLRGEYENLLSFIYKLEAMPYYIDIKSMNISAGAAARQNLKEKDNSEGELQAVVIIKVFKNQHLDDKK